MIPARENMSTAFVRHANNLFQMNRQSKSLSSFSNAFEIRAKTIQAIRNFFYQRGYLEVDTPVRIPAPATELHIDAFSSEDLFLRTSPELHMKRMLASGYKRIFQIGPCFRKGEKGELHNPEFCMLEWYRANADYLDILAETKALIAETAENVLKRTWLKFRCKQIELMPVWESMTVTEAFMTYAGWNPVTDFDAERFDTDLVNKVEPRLRTDIPVVLMNYPTDLAALARLKPDNAHLAERWELYIGGIEIANAFSELTDTKEQRQRFKDCARKREAMGKETYPVDEDFMKALEKGMPPAAGVALGIDRLVMLLCEAESLDEILPFR